METLTPPRLQERRRNLKLRAQFATAKQLLEPLLGKPENHTGAGFYRALHQLQAALPDLTDSELEALIAAVVRSVLHQNGRR